MRLWDTLKNELKYIKKEGFFLKILRIAPDLYPHVVGGICIHAHEMSKEQARMGHDVTVYTASEGIKCEYEALGGYHVRNFKPLVKILGNSITPNMFINLIKDQSKYDVIHAHSHLFFSTNLSAVARELGSTPLVITNHGLNSQTAPKWFQNIYTATGARLTFAAADKIICYTESEKKELVDIGIKSQKIKVIHNGIDTDLFVPSKETSFDKKNLLWVGRYARGKGLEYLIDAFNIVKSRHPKATLTMIGEGPEKDRIVQKINDLNLGNSIIMKDFVQNSELAGLYQNSSVFVLPSLEEGVPRTILESMSCGIPVVCSRLPQLVDIVDGGGILVPVKDSQTLGDRISEVLSNSSLAEEFRENGRRNVVENYSWKDTVKETIKLYEELV
ncbi:Glycosyltransferase [Methanosarcina siciliae C2J]|uniref:Glycosyltransferase n=1 Tax=Methanosarcina siciliae C2J TaxID=1434118 RepID=A0A0E3PTE4_9EURY|nr:Glycosyltransferase [Methanosarcina siciliae C2J]